MAVDRTDPANRIVDYTDSDRAVGRIDIGDRASTYIFNENGPSSFKFIGKDGGSGARSALKEIAATGDSRAERKMEGDDGESRQAVNLFDGDGNPSDDFIALVTKAKAGEGGLSLVVNSDNEIEVHVEGRWSTDILKFSGGFVQDALTTSGVLDPHVNLFDRNDQTAIYDFDVIGKPVLNLYHGRDDALDQSPDGIGSILNGSSLKEGDELDALIKAALDEKYGLGDTKGLEFAGNDDDSIVVKITNNNVLNPGDDNQKGPGVDTLILKGEAVEAAIADYAGDKINLANKKEEVALLDDTGGRIGVNESGFFSADKVELGDGETTLEEFDGQGIQGDEIAAIVKLALEHQNPDSSGDDQFAAGDDLKIISGGQSGDDHITLGIQTPKGPTDVMIFEGEEVEQAVADYYDSIA